jgi:serine/threonine protein kinase
MRLLCHPNIIKFYEVIGFTSIYPRLFHSSIYPETPNSIYLVTEYADGGELFVCLFLCLFFSLLSPEICCISRTLKGTRGVQVLSHAD